MTERVGNAGERGDADRDLRTRGGLKPNGSDRVIELCGRPDDVVRRDQAFDESIRGRD
jgi:hypothetical protein